VPTINEGGGNQFLARRFNITDAFSPASTLAPEVMPVVQVYPPSQEDDYLRGTRRCGASGRQQAVAANYAVATLSNPAGSGILVMLDEILVNDTANGMAIEHYLERVALPAMGAVGSGVKDSRWPLPSSRTQARFGIGVTPTAPNIAWIYFSRTMFWTNTPPIIQNAGIVIAPGSMYIAYVSFVNYTLDITLSWRERVAQPSELV